MNQHSNINSTGDVYLKYTTITPVPTAQITVNRNRLKVYGSNVFLKDATYFEIELWNPKTTRVLAKISINGTFVTGGGIVVNPGQRVYLERFVDEDRKFSFRTYEAENSAAGRQAIQHNGEVRIDFYDEITVQHYGWNYCSAGSITIQDPSPFYGGGTSTPLMNPTFTTNVTNQYFSNSNMNLCDDGHVTMDATFNASSPIGAMKADSVPSTIETGRIEKGEKSDQRLLDTFGDFSLFTCASYYYKIMPESQKPSEIGEIRSYCTGCGRRWRSGENFCPTCGTPKNK